MGLHRQGVCNLFADPYLCGMVTPALWVEIPDNSDFTADNLPFGIFSAAGRPRRVGIAVGDRIVDLAAVAEEGLWQAVDSAVWQQSSLNAFIRLGKTVTTGVRQQVQQWLCEEESPLRDKPALWVDQCDAQLHLPIAIGDYTDFYSSIEHATNVGKLFRDPDRALLPNWRHLPVAYHGRSSSIVPGGMAIRRPYGQVLPAGSEVPQLQPTDRLDFELETAFVIGRDSTLGQPISTAEAADHIFGMLLFNDWSARDIQKWEYVPLGPFLGKNFASSLSPWVVTMEALAPFRVSGAVQEPPVLPYLTYNGLHHYDIQLEVGIEPADGAETIVTRSNARYMYWNIVQQLAHHTVNGCNVRIGDLLASGTISGYTPDSYGSMLELSLGGSRSVDLGGGQARTFIQDYDSVILRGYAQKGKLRVGFGEVRTQVLPAL